jgi:hypothetical protein
LPRRPNSSSDVSRKISAGRLVSLLSLRFNLASDVSCQISAGTLVNAKSIFF